MPTHGLAVSSRFRPRYVGAFIELIAVTAELSGDSFGRAVIVELIYRDIRSGGVNGTAELAHLAVNIYADEV